jgi:RimJ/RimL family protein N-acetyltransferase
MGLFRFERTTHQDIVTQIITHPAIYPHVSDDGSPEVSEFKAPIAESIWHVLVWQEDELLGLWTLTAENAVCAKVHTCLLPTAHGKAKEAVAEFGDWVWANTPFARVITDIPLYNTPARALALSAGMEPYGLNEKSFLKDGILHDQVLMGITRPGV